MPYNERWNRTTPGCLIILVDQSDSMNDVMAKGLVGEGAPKKLAAAMVVNGILREIISRCTDLGDVKHRVDIGLIGYGGTQATGYSAWLGNLNGRDLVPITEIAENPARENMAKKKELNLDTGDIEEVEIKVPIWLEPVAGDGTPMCAALKLAHAWASNWASTHGANFPPVIINVTDGEANDGDPVPYAQSIATDVRTSDGAALVFNCHLSAQSGNPVKYPSDLNQVRALVTDPHAQQFATQLFNMSSVLADPMIKTAQDGGLSIDTGARGFVFGGDMEDMSKFISFVSGGGLR